MHKKDNGTIIIALDVPGEERALELVDLLLPLTPYFKVGLELFNHVGPAVVQKIKTRGGSVFLDLKYHDIPNTAAGAARAAVATGAFMFNLHAMGGEEMLRFSVEAASEESEKLGVKCPLILGVTVLTSFTAVSLKQVGIERSPEGQVLELARLCQRCGLQGVVASPRETARLRRELGDDFVIVTPGVRLPGAALQDQKRVMAPWEAVEAGANYVVIGRPVTAASDPHRALKEIIEAMTENSSLRKEGI
jgi:orotidine-5'-phosphate decarboxylase